MKLSFSIGITLGALRALGAFGLKTESAALPDCTGSKEIGRGKSVPWRSIVINFAKGPNKKAGHIHRRIPIL
jgi:hypothetical protein